MKPDPHTPASQRDTQSHPGEPNTPAPNAQIVARIDSTCPVCSVMLVVAITQRSRGPEFKDGYSVGLTKSLPPPIGTCDLSDDPHEEGEHAEEYGGAPGDTQACRQWSEIETLAAANSAQQGAAPSLEWRSLSGYTLAELLETVAAEDVSSTVANDLVLAAEHFRTAAPTPEYVSGWLAKEKAVLGLISQTLFYLLPEGVLKQLAADIRALAPPSAPPVQQIEQLPSESKKS